ncbi:deoxyribodipyrimidine photo-lyase [Pseudomonas oryzihabitans]|uniref:deoxyribodipyrimidine photo-lyase n=1 Tax=Pseudomonas oryzihabitans TaxID=47885 RepID=UPI0028960DD3|nr:deoxyribodipyrimidine photo-lyase [Pseudomonas oryzihabitans]MDT3719254.1 deoxyribodipyrimidine photo-lyase [Pseudomonas oryzihabitans]
MSGLVWFRTDLRHLDHPALHAAVEQGPVIAVFLVSPAQWQAHDEAPVKVDFWLRNLAELGKTLKALGIPLLVRKAATWEQAPQVLLDLAREVEAQHLYFNDEYGLNEAARDEAVTQAFDTAGLVVHRYLDQTLFAPGTVLTKSGGYFKVFGQFKKTCLARLETGLPTPLPAPGKQQKAALQSDELPTRIDGFAEPVAEVRQLWPAGEQAALQRLATFIRDDLDDYHQARDIPSEPGTSQLSAYLNAGVLSPRQCLQAAVEANGGRLSGGSQGAATWITELLWREFYRHVLVGYPWVSRHQPFNRELAALPWRDDPDGLAAWQQGRTGIPIIDAAMRQLQQTGWMHNRMRMLTAMFLCKNLLIDWREGERWFMRHLVDGDLASNNGGWQWSASTGTDSVPYFRVFNPQTQALKIDARGDYVRTWVPELAELKGKAVHTPGARYLTPLVDLGESRQRALAAYRGMARKTAKKKPD